MRRLACLLVLLCVGSLAYGAIARVQTANNTCASCTFFTVTFPAPVTTGNTVVCGVATAVSATVNFVAPTMIGGTFNVASQVDAFGRNAEIWYATNITGGTSAVTVAVTGVTNRTFSAICSEYSGLMTTVSSPAIVDVTAFNNGYFTGDWTSNTQTGTACGSVCAPVAQTLIADELWFAVGIADNDVGAVVSASAPTNGYAEIAERKMGGDNGNMVAWDKIATATGFPVLTATSSGPNVDRAGALATFKIAGAALPSQTLSITKSGTGTGTVTTSPVGSPVLNCGLTCSASYDQGQVVTLVATPTSGSVFAGWSGDADCTNGSVTMSVPVSCNAVFNIQATTIYYVRPGGNNACNGLSSATGSSGTCAWATVNFGINAIQPGDTLTIMAGTYNENIVRSTALSSSVLTTTIQGDPNNADVGDPNNGGSYGANSINIEGTGSPAVVMTFSGGLRNVVFKHFRVHGGTRSLMQLSLGSELDIKWEDVTFDDNPGTLSYWNGTQDMAMMLFLSPFAGGVGARRSEVSNCRFLGDTTNDGIGSGNVSHPGTIGNVNSPFVTSVAGAIIHGGNNAHIGYGPPTEGLWTHDSIFSNLGTWVIGQGQSDSIFERNWIGYGLGDGDDGMLQYYNDRGSIVRDNVFFKNCPMTNHGMINTRSTPDVNPGDCGGKASSLEVVGNTFIMDSSCHPTTMSNGIAIFRGDQCQNGQANLNTAAVNNLFVGDWGDPNRQAAAITFNPASGTGQCPGGGKGFYIDHNLWDTPQTKRNLVAYILTNACPFPVTPSAIDSDPGAGGTYDYVGAGDYQGSAGLTASYAPALSSSPACSGRVYVMEDGTASNGWIGALQGACGVVIPPTPNPKLIGASLGPGTSIK